MHMGIGPVGPADEALQPQAVLPNMIGDRCDVLACHVRQQAADRGCGMMREGLSLASVDKGCQKGVQTRHDRFKDRGCDLTLVKPLVVANGVASIHGSRLLAPIRFLQTTVGTHL